MHLTDNQLLELNASTQSHVLDCAQCNQRAAHLLNIRKQLNELPIISQSENGWSAIQKLHLERQQESRLQHNQTKLKFWQVGSFALAASLVIVLLWPALQESDQSRFNQDYQLAILIEQNNLLQQQLLQRQISNGLVNFNVGHLEFELNKLDQLIQKAYLEKSNDTSKRNLWNKRQELIKKLLTETNHDQKKIIAI